MRKLSAILGLLAVLVFLFTFTLFSFLSPNFDLVHDVVSKLGAYNQPYATWWNITGFGVVGVLLSAFGVTYGKAINDNLIAALLAFFGIAFIGASIPAYLDSPSLTQTKIHFVIVTFCMAFWCLSLARITSNPALRKKTRIISNISAAFVVFAFIGYILNSGSVAIFQKLFFGGIFFWIVAISLDNLFSRDLNKTT